MNIHKNARTTPRSRGQIVERVLTGREAPRAVATAVGVSARTVHKWVARYGAEAEAGLADRSCRPRRSPRATPALLASWVEHLRRQRWTGGEIAQALQLSPSTVARLLRRHGLARLRQLEPPVPVRRYQWASPGDLLHLDVKKLARIGRVGHRITAIGAPRCGASAGSLCTSRLTTPRAWLTSKCCPMRAGSRRRSFCGAPGPGSGGTASASAG